MKKSIIIGLVLFIVYNIALYIIKPWHQKTMYPYWVLENYGKAQRYTRPDIQPQWVLCGSSLTAGMDHYLPDSVHSLAMTGGSIFTGMEIMNSTGKLPPVIGIETNMMLRLTDVYITDDALNPVMMELRNYLPGIAVYNQPFSFLAYALLGNTEKRNQIRFSQENKILNQPLYDEQIPAKIIEYNQPYDSIVLAEHIEYMVEKLKDYEAKGSKVFIFEAPMDPTLYYSVRMRTLRAKLRQLPFLFVEVPLYHKWKTADGEHKTPSDCATYTYWMMHKVPGMLEQHYAQHNE
jgi:hypothetical protein